MADRWEHFEVRKLEPITIRQLLAGSPQDQEEALVATSLAYLDEAFGELRGSAWNAVYTLSGVGVARTPTAYAIPGNFNQTIFMPLPIDGVRMRYSKGGVQKTDFNYMRIPARLGELLPDPNHRGEDGTETIFHVKDDHAIAALDDALRHIGAREEPFPLIDQSRN